MASEDELFLGEMSQLSEEELINILGNVIPIYTDDGTLLIYNPSTNTIYNTVTGQTFDARKNKLFQENPYADGLDSDTMKKAFAAGGPGIGINLAKMLMN